jgi:hypothetical protein
MFLVLILLVVGGAAVGTGAIVNGGGGGGGGGAVAAAPVVNPAWIVTQQQADAYRTPEYNAQWGLEDIHAAEAYADLAKNSKPLAGLGVKVGIDDQAVLLTHQEIDANNNGSYISPTNVVGDHGTHVASTAAGVKDGVGMHGVAFNAQITSYDFFSSFDGLNSNTIGISALAADGADAINMSWHFCPNGCGNPTLINVGDANYTAYYNFLAPEFDAAKNSNSGKGTVLAVATANDALTSPDIPSIFSQDARLGGIMISVAAVDSNNSIASFSNRCGAAENYCLAAPGVGIFAAVASSDSSYGLMSGTSMATPHVTGAAAVIRAAWPFLTAAQTVQILLRSATDLGAPGVDPIYGHGLLNLYAAVQQQGSNFFAYGTSVNSSFYDLRYSSMTTSPIFGDAFATKVAPQLNSAVFFDDYGRDYKAFLGNKISAQPVVNGISLQNLAFNNSASRTIPLNFGERNQFKFNFSSYKNSDSKNSSSFNSASPSSVHNGANVFGLKYVVLDNSKDQSSAVNNSFSFVRNSSDIVPNLKLGFAFNTDQISALNQNEFGNQGFILQNNLASNPYQSFFNTNSSTANTGIFTNSASGFASSRKFNQFFVDKGFFNNQLQTKFSYQSSYESAQVNTGFGKKENEAFDLGLSFNPKTNFFGHEFNAGKFMVSFGNLNEFNNNMLNSKSLGAFGTGSNVKTSYAKISSSQALTKNLFLLASISDGRTKIDGNSQGIFRSFNDVRTSSSSVALIYDNFFGGKIGASYAEPMRVYRGTVNVDVPVARDNAGNVTRYQATASLVPNGKEKDYEIFFSRNLSSNSEIRFNFLTQRERGNIKNAPVNHLGFVQFNKKW